MRLYEQGFYGEAVVMRDGVAERFHLASTSSYKMKVCPQNQPSEDFGTYKMGFEKKDKRFIPVGEWNMLYPDEDEKMVEGTAASSADEDITYIVNKNHNLEAKVCFQYLTQQQYPLLHKYKFTRANLTFDYTFSSIKGTASDKNPEEETSVKGTVSAGDKKNEMPLEGILEPEQLEKLQRFQLQVNSMPSSVGIVFSSHELLVLENCLGRSVLELYNLPQPEDMSQVHQLCFQKLLKMTAHAAHKSGNEIKDYLGLGVPTVSDVGGDLSCAQAKLAEESSAFLLDGLGISYLSYAYSESTQEQIKKPIVDIPQYNEKIKYYMQGKDKGCMSQTQDYQKLTSSLYRQVYISNVVGLSEYVAEQGNEKEQGKQDWAKKLYTYCNNPEILNGLILTNLVDPNNTRINHLCSILDALDQTDRVTLEINAEPDDPDNEVKKYSFSVALRKQVTDLTFKYAVKNIRLLDKDDEKSKKVFNETLVAFMQTYFKNLEGHLFANWSSEIYDQAYQELKEAVEEAGYDTVEKYITNFTTVVADITNLLVSMRCPDMPTAIVKFFEKRPKTSRAICGAFYILGITSLILGFKDWGKLTPLEKSELISGVVAIGVQVIGDLTAWKACGVFKRTLGNLQAADSQMFKSITQADFVKVMSRSDDMETALTKLGLKSADLSTSEGDIMAAASKWMKISRIGAVAAKMVSALLMAAVLAFQILETVKDFNSGQPVAVEVLDIIQAVSNGVCFLAEAGAGIIALCGAQVCSVIPVVGAIFAFVGIVTAIVSIFIKRKEPETPVEKFIREKCVPFVKKQSPTKEWIEEQKKIAEYLSGKKLPQEVLCV